MPTYEYACDNCGHEFERFQSITAQPLKRCPLCGENRLQRLIGAGGGVIFKGSGFYVTDYRSESYKKAAEAEKSAQKSAAGSEPARSDGTTGAAAAQPTAKSTQGEQRRHGKRKAG